MAQDFLKIRAASAARRPAKAACATVAGEREATRRLASWSATPPALARRAPAACRRTPTTRSRARQTPHPRRSHRPAPRLRQYAAPGLSPSSRSPLRPAGHSRGPLRTYDGATQRRLKARVRTPQDWLKILRQRLLRIHAHWRGSAARAERTLRRRFVAPPRACYAHAWAPARAEMAGGAWHSQSKQAALSRVPSRSTSSGEWRRARGRSRCPGGGGWHTCDCPLAGRSGGVSGWGISPPSAAWGWRRSRSG
jgi:hypothetical protein